MTKSRFAARSDVRSVGRLAFLLGLAILGILAACQPDKQESAVSVGVKAPTLTPVNEIPKGWVVKSPVGENPLLEPPAKQDHTASEKLNAQSLDLAKAGKLDEAAGLLLQALLANKDNAKAWNNLGLVLRQMGRPRDAIQAYLKAITLRPKDAITYKNLGVALELLGNRVGAAKSLREYLRLAPDAPDAAAVTQQALRLERNNSSSRGGR